MFKRIPLMLALGGELRGPFSYKATTVMDVPVLLTRNSDGVVRAFVNQCSHRGAVVVADGHDTSRRFACPYHAWTYDTNGDLVGVTDREFFGSIDPTTLGLTPLPVAERAGMIFVVLTPGAPMDIDAHLCGYDKVLDFFGFGDWHLIKQTAVAGPNWKIAYDGYLDFYHLPVLHKKTFGEAMPNQANYYAWGPHQHVQAPGRDLLDLDAIPEVDWKAEDMLKGVWTIFPHVSIASFQGGGRAVLISQLLPGAHVGESFTTQIYLTEQVPTEEQAVEAHAQFKFLEHVVRDEDYATGLRQQVALKNGGRDHVLFGENEGGAQRFHGWVDRLLHTDDVDLDALFAAG